MKIPITVDDMLDSAKEQRDIRFYILDFYCKKESAYKEQLITHVRTIEKDYSVKMVEAEIELMKGEALLFEYPLHAGLTYLGILIKITLKGLMEWQRLYDIKKAEAAMAEAERRKIEAELRAEKLRQN